MRRLLPVLFPLLLGAGAAHAGDPRALIERAIRAEGGPDRADLPYPVYAKQTGVSLFGGDKLVPVVEELYHTRDGRSRMVFHVELEGETKEFTVIINRREGWKSVNGVVSEFTEAELAYSRTLEHVGRFDHLVPLLKDKAFTLKLAGEQNVDGRVEQGVTASYPNQPDVTIYFDKETGFARRVVFMLKPLGESREVKHVIVKREFRPVDHAGPDEELLRKAKMDTTGPGLLAFVRSQTADPVRARRARELVAQLGAKAFRVRAKAARDLLALGMAGREALADAAKSGDPEVSRRAGQILEQLRKKADGEVGCAAVRLLALRRPEGAAQALLDYLPGAEPEVAREVQAALYLLAHQGGKPDPAIERALRHKNPVCRAAAAAALEKDGGAYARRPGRRLYPDRLMESHRHLAYIDGKKFSETRLVELRIYNKLDDQLFAKP